MGSLALAIIGMFILNMTVFATMVHAMAEQMQPPGLLPVKVLLVLGAVEVFALITAYILRRSKSEKKQPAQKKDYKQILILFSACALFLCVATTYLRFVPAGAVTMMADINRVDLFGVINNNPITMMAYYIKSLGGISQANAVCVVVPLFFYVAVVCALWEVAAALFAEDASKRNLCFLAEAILVLFGNCMFSMTGIITSGLVQMTNILLAIALPTVFSLCVRIYRADKKDTIAYWVVGILMLVCLYILDAVAFVLTAMTVFIFVLLIIGRRYLPWLRSSN